MYKIIILNSMELNLYYNFYLFLFDYNSIMTIRVLKSGGKSVQVLRQFQAYFLLFNLFAPLRKNTTHSYAFFFAFGQYLLVTLTTIYTYQSKHVCDSIEVGRIKCLNNIQPRNSGHKLWNLSFIIFWLNKWPSNL